MAACAMTFGACQHPGDDVQPTISSNGTNSNNGNSGTNNGSTAADTALCFERDVLPIFISNCSMPGGCHDAISATDGYVFTSYATITAKKFRAGSPDETELYEKITEDKPDKIMPPPPNAPLTQQQRAIIYRWIKEGAKNTTGCVAGCDSTKASFAANIQPVLNQNCKGCHNSVGASGGVNLEAYAGVQTVAQNGRLLGAIKHLAGYSPMPKGGNMLSSCQIRQVERWISEGVQNN